MSKSQKLYGMIIPILFGLWGLNTPLLPPSVKINPEAVFGLNETEFLSPPVIEQTTFLPLSPIGQLKVLKKMNVLVTAYSPSVCETDDTPFITASGKYVQENFIANNSLPFGTKVRLPHIFPNKTFIVEDRMHWTRNGYYFDVLMFSRQKALEFGAKYTELEVLD